jgi:hypothetical protein
MRKTLIKANNYFVRRRRLRAAPGEVLLLLPHCLQRKACRQNVMNDLDECRRCGKCNIADLLDLRDELGVSCRLVGGGREALAAVRDASVKVVVAVACEKELTDGLRAAFPKAILAIPNVRPCGFCRDTRVDVAAVREAIQSFLRPAKPAPRR